MRYRKYSHKCQFPTAELFRKYTGIVMDRLIQAARTDSLDVFVFISIATQIFLLLPSTILFRFGPGEENRRPTALAFSVLITKRNLSGCQCIFWLK